MAPEARAQEAEPQVSPQPQQPEAAASSGAGTTQLPELHVDTAAEKKKSTAKKKKAAKASSAAPAQAASATPVAAPTGATESAYGPVKGYVATRSATASKTDTPLIETPQSVSVVTADQIATIGASSLTQALGYTPGIYAQPSIYSRIADDFMIRGFNVANGNGGLLRDGMKLQSNVYDGGTEPYGLERLEVLKGPASILYGQTAPGGVVNAVSKRPTLDDFGEINLETGNYDRKQVSADLGGKVTADGEWTYRFTGLLRESDAEVDFVNDDKVYIAPALTWRPSAATSVTMLASYQKIDTKFAPPMAYSDLIDETMPRDLFIGEPDFDEYKSDTYLIGYLAEHAFTPNVKLRHKLRYFEADVTFNYIGERSGISGGTLTRLAQARDEVSTGLTTDTSLEAKFGTEAMRHTLLAGIDYYHSTYDRHRFRGLHPNLDIDNPTYGTDVVLSTVDEGFNWEGDQTGAYLQDQIKLYDKWVLLLGGRYDWAENLQTTYRNGSTSSYDEEAFTKRAGLVYLFDNGLAPYVSYSESFQPVAGESNGVPNVPTEGTQYEAGVRYQPPGTRILMTASVYDLTQINVVTSDGAGDTRQIGEVQSKGVELEAKGEFNELSLIASYAYTHAEITESLDVDELGEQLALVPLHTAALWADYDMSVFGLEGIRAGAGLRYVSSTNIPGFDGDVPSYVLVDALVSYDLATLDPELEGTSLSVRAHNLFGKEYFTCVTADGCRYGDPRTVFATLSRKF